MAANKQRRKAVYAAPKVFQEPRRKSLYDALRENFKTAHRQTYVHRLIYIGEHLYANAAKKGIDEVFEKVIKSINDHYCDEKLTGFLLYYSRYFCHVIDGSEETLIKHLKLIILNDYVNNKLGRLKMLVAYHHVNQRFLSEWMVLTSKPPTLLEKPNPDSDLKQTMDKITYCIRKLYKLGIALRPDTVLDEEQEGEEEEEEQQHSEYGQQLSAGISEKVSNIRRGTNIFGDELNPLVNYLPEHSILEFLLGSTYIPDLRRYLAMFGGLPFLDAYEDLVWPVPCDFVPMTIFEKEHDAVTDLPEQQT